jgi:hypothetical protein
MLDDADKTALLDGYSRVPVALTFTARLSLSHTFDHRFSAAGNAGREARAKWLGHVGAQRRA